MATEFEYKWVISLNIAQEKDLLKKCFYKHEIQQGYLPGPELIRLREDGEDRFFTYKRQVGDRLIEIETNIDFGDFDDLWPLCKDKLSKIRYDFNDKQFVACVRIDIHYTWSLDVFLENGTPYFVLLEIELGHGSPRPEMLALFKDYVLYEVPLTDDRFSSKRLSNIAYAKNIYKEVKDEELQNC